MGRHPRGVAYSTMRRSHLEARKSTLFSADFDDEEEGPRENCIHEGYLLKSVAVFDGMGMKWRKRYCRVFEGVFPTMTVALTKNHDHPDESLPLDDATIRLPSRKKHTGVSLLFEVKNIKYSVQEAHVFAMLPNDGDVERDEWMRKLEMAGLHSEGKSRCQLLEEKLTPEELKDIETKAEEYKLLPKSKIDDILRELQEEEEKGTKQLKQKYVDLKCKMVDLLGERFGQEFQSLGKVVPHNIHSSESPLQKQWAVLSSRPSSIA